MKLLSNIFLLIAITLLLYACPQSLTPKMKAEMQIMYYLRDIHTDSLYRPGDFSDMSEIVSRDDVPAAKGAKYKIFHTYTLDGETRKEKRSGMFYIASDYKVVHVKPDEKNN